jgi:hypothetical protein
MEEKDDTAGYALDQLLQIHAEVKNSNYIYNC